MEARHPVYMWIPTSHPRGFPCGSAGIESACNVGDLGLIPGLGRSPGERKGYPLQHSGLEHSMDSSVHGVTKSRTRLGNFHTHLIQYTEGKSMCIEHANENQEAVELSRKTQLSAADLWLGRVKRFSNKT